ncbi:MAG: NAD-dependent epimerase/dehydratase family protein [Myxococcota bacterium]
MKAVVTGATGHLGNVLVRALLERGEAVRAVLAPGEDARPLDGLPVERVEGDVRSPEAMVRCFEGARDVFHLAGIVSISQGQEALMEAVNVGGTRNVLEAAKKVGARRLIYVGSIHALATPPGLTLDETAGFDVGRVVGAYGKTKAQASNLVQRAAAQLDTVLVLPTGVLGPYDYRLSEMGQLLRALAQQRVPCLLPGGHEWLDVRDFASGTLAAAERGRRGEAYLLNGEWRSLQDLARLVHDETGARVPPLLPLALARLLTGPALAWEKLTSQRSLLTPYALEAVSAPFRVDDGKARRELGHRSRPMAETVHDALRWFAENETARRVGPGRKQRLAHAEVRT